MSLSRIEEILTGGEVKPQSRIEQILMGEDIVPQSRIEVLLKEKLGGGGGGGAEITDGIVVKARDADGEATEVDIYGEVIYPYTMGSSVSSDYKWFGRKVTKANLMSDVVEIKSGAFEYSGLEEIHIPDTCSIFGLNALRYNSKLVNVSCAGSIDFSDNNGRYMFYGDKTALQTVVLGSVGHKVTTTRNDVFYGAYSNLTLTIYADSADADNVLSKFRNGATNATIIIKDSTTGETLITSTP